ncbi:MAG TPA: hypothetical protein VMV10_31950 [Pirellulales bacterium]|nr:hypothetical protein [Pirellulales bacterium]
MLPLVRRCRRLYFSYLSQPSGDRVVYRQLSKRRVSKILELGIGEGTRSLRMLELATHGQPPAAVSYTGVDLFESRSTTDGPGLSLKLAHQRFKATGARVRLAPGDPYSALSRIANELGAVDLMLISADQLGPSLAKAWFYVPRLLHAETQVFIELAPSGDGKRRLSRLTHFEIKDRAAQAAPRRMAA